MDERDFNKAIGALLSQEGVNEEFAKIIDKMIDMLDETDMDDYFGSEGWRHMVGWD